MHFDITVSSDVYEELKKHPLFFLKLQKHYVNDIEVNTYDDSKWLSNNCLLELSYPASKCDINDSDYCLCVIEIKEKQNSKETNNGYKTVGFHNASENDVNDWKIIINNYINRCYDNDDKYAFVELLWFLNKRNINGNLYNAIKSLDARLIPFIVNQFKRICRCLSLNKQRLIKTYIDNLGGHYSYDIYMPTIITEAYDLCEMPNNEYGISNEKDNLNIFQLIDAILEKYNSNFQGVVGINKNMLLKLKIWLSSETSLQSYSILNQLFSVVNESTRFKIVKRYFHDIRIGNTSFNDNIVRQFIDNPFDEFIRYRYAIETPSDQIVLRVPLLCDSILTIYKSHGEAFQTFNGILDFAMSHCNATHPNIDFKLETFIPICNGGAVYNRGCFKGFIDYQVVRKIDVSKLTDASLMNSVRFILDSRGTNQKYPICKYDGSKIDDVKFTKCSKFPKIGKNSNQQSVSTCYTYKNYDDKWLVTTNEDNIKILNSFLKDNVQAEKINLSVNLEMISIEKFREYIRSLPSLYENVGEGAFLVHSYSCCEKTYELKLIEKFSVILKMRIIPQKGALIGKVYDAFGFWEKEKLKLSPSDLSNKNSAAYHAAEQRYAAKESEEVYKCIVDSLKKELKIQDYNGSYFEVEYDRSILVKIINNYYFKESFKENDGVNEHEFLTHLYVNEQYNKDGQYKQYYYYCSPKLSDKSNQAIELPFFWCRGKECFRNNLGNQTLASTNDWNHYSLFHLIEIIGYPKLHKTIAGYEPDNVVRTFIAVVNKVMRKFEQLKCRKCGHLMFTNQNGNFNSYNYFVCKNTTCSEFGKRVYLNYCFNCKKGLIDSRDTKQCPNGWYICPTCLSCCNDDAYERQAQKYTVIGRSVPQDITKMLGHGHNDKGKFFCPYCGTLLKLKDKSSIYYSCPSCKREFNRYMRFI